MPRFAPYTQRLLSLLLKKPLPPGPVLVPACGPGTLLVVLQQCVFRAGPSNVLFNTENFGAADNMGANVQARSWSCLGRHCQTGSSLETTCLLV